LAAEFGLWAGTSEVMGFLILVGLGDCTDNPLPAPLQAERRENPMYRSAFSAARVDGALHIHQPGWVNRRWWIDEA
jgi:hypothetical protein